MQNTRLNTSIAAISNWFEEQLRNPWRKLLFRTLALLFGFFLGSAIATTAGQLAQLDIWVAALLTIFSELISRLTYSPRNRQLAKNPIVQTLNAIKIGIVYSLAVEALKLGS